MRQIGKVRLKLLPLKIGRVKCKKGVLIDQNEVFKLLLCLLLFAFCVAIV